MPTPMHPHSSIQQRLHTVFHLGTAACLALLALTTHTCVTAQVNAPSIALTSAPLHLNTNTEHPTMLLALSVEFPTAGALYMSGGGAIIDSSYSNTTRYLGYFDTQSCYSYVKAPPAPAAPHTAEDYKRFTRDGPASSQRTCSNAFSGNFLNWATSSSIDMLRLALSGGDRTIDTTNNTTLQRAHLPCITNGALFPQKQLSRQMANGESLWGAVPVALRNLAGPNGLWISNMGNQFTVGAQPGSYSCDALQQGALQSLARTSGLSNDTFFYARVQVCELKNGVLNESRHYNLCTRYPNGQYKPTGTIQKYSHQLRIAVFGYLNDNNPQTHGGVLRAPMKYVGPRTFDTLGRDNTPATGNPHQEWDPHTGIFNSNPDKSTRFPISGAINYLNQFGRIPTPHPYKTYDPVGALYYQSLRYLQGLPPSPEAIANITPEQHGGFPVYTQWSDPFGEGRSDKSNYACLKNNIALIGDVYTHDGYWQHLPPASAANNIPDFRHWLNVVEHFERGTSTSYLDNIGQPHTTRNPNAANMDFPTHSSASQLIAYAYWAHSHDIRGRQWTGPSAAQDARSSKRRPGLRVKTFIFDVNEQDSSSDPAKRQHNNPFFLAAKYGGYATSPTALDPTLYNPYGNPFFTIHNEGNNQLWQKHDAPGEAASYFLQSDAQAVLDAFEEIFNRTAVRANSLAGKSSNSNAITDHQGTHQYMAYFDTGDWSGDVQKQALLANNNRIQLGPAIWSAAERLRTTPAANRKIFTGNGTQAGTPFTWANIPDAMRAHLARSTPTQAPDNYAQQRLLHLRGDQSAEGALLRTRKELLGDIAHSNVVYHGAPSPQLSGAGYQAFRQSMVQRPATIYAGANDGMLHAFQDDDGSELFAYIPSWLGPRLPALTDPQYLSQHQSFVDGPLTVKEAQLNFTDSATDWKTVLVGSTGRGGAGVFALDVSRPDQFAAQHILWEFTRTDDSDLGLVLGAPQILKFKTSGSNAPTTYRWFAVFGSGVNNHVPEYHGGPASDSGNPALFLLALDKPTGQAWRLGDNYFKVTIPTSADLKATHANGLLNFSVLYGAAGEVTELYTGDLHGNLWKLRWADLLPSQWSLARLSAFNRGTAANPAPYPLYSARDAAGTPQPISAAPLLLSGPISDTLETFYVAFGTGKYLENSDLYTTAPHSFYVVYDNGSHSTDGGSNPFTTGYRAAILGRQRLVAASLNSTTATFTTPAFRWGRASSNNDASRRSGWYLDLPANGERMVFAMQDLTGGQAAFNTLSPNVADAELGVCTPLHASGTSYTANLIQGQGQHSLTETERLGAPMYFLHDTLTITSPTDSTGRRLRTTVRAAPNTSASAGLQVQIPEVIGRLNWREVHNYQELRQAP